MKDDKWVKRWVCPSSSGGGDYIVAQDADGNYACSCPGWTRNVAKSCPVCHMPMARKDAGYCWKCKEQVEPVVKRINCKHIYEVLAGRARTLAEATLDRMTGEDHHSVGSDMKDRMIRRNRY